MVEDIIFKEGEFILRFILAAFCGGLIGLEREKRAKTAGVRTHVLVAISASLMMVVSKYGFFDVIGYDSISVDASRIAAGVVSAIGFLGVGVIFVKKDNAIGVTTAAGLWATVGMGICVGCGLYLTGIAFTIFILIFQWIFHMKHVHPYSQSIGVIEFALKDGVASAEYLEEELKKQGLSMRSYNITRSAEGETILKARIFFQKHESMHDVIERMSYIGDVRSIEILNI